LSAAVSRPSAPDEHSVIRWLMRDARRLTGVGVEQEIFVPSESRPAKA
jgi:hypothetical protein